MVGVGKEKGTRECKEAVSYGQKEVRPLVGRPEFFFSPQLTQHTIVLRDGFGAKITPTDYRKGRKNNKNKHAEDACIATHRAIHTPRNPMLQLKKA
ncbi:unnamed protein product [Dovyalis caffra]|uniref:Ribosomal protein S11 n=1 Tax=Dovyalis caffra TaxID=77055 RepID=A0AAV1RXC8_9ROSI|nr:unnamed protein product [Dovyalis caffra]